MVANITCAICDPLLSHGILSPERNDVRISICEGSQGKLPPPNVVVKIWYVVFDTFT
ncbi:MAG: hypothetical protein OXC64_05750 [Flavobacteriaceae bacterium]|nr:hypothetical protein [Flavobacteriaceae bacterium]